MAHDDIRDQVLELLHQSGEHALTATEISDDLSLRGKPRKKMEKLLAELIRDGEIARVKNRYWVGGRSELVTGTLQVVRSGNGYVAPIDGGPSIFVVEDDLGVALPGDKVLVRRYEEGAQQQRKPAERRGRRPAERRGRKQKTDAPKGLAGKVIRILERSGRQIVGTVRKAGHFPEVHPMSPGYKRDFYVSDLRGAAVNDRVLLRFVNWVSADTPPEGEVVEVIGPADDPSIDTIAVIKEYDLPTDFPLEVVRDAESVSARLGDCRGREDLRQELVITIDPKQARDFDDALSLAQDAHGNRIVGVHIADVSHYVKHGGALDMEARRRGNSTYLVDKVLPMLPEQLSNSVCSLRPGEDRLALSAFLVLDGKGNVVRSRFAETVIHSKARLTYEQAMAIIASETPALEGFDFTPEVLALVRELSALAQQLRRRRFQQYALELDTAECSPIIEENGVMSGFRMVPNDPSHQLVEECMVAANEAVSRTLHEARYPQVFRVHEAPKEEKLEALAAELVGLGYSPGNLGQKRNLARFLRSVENDPMGHHVRMSVLRSMNRAEYSTVPAGHYGLSKKFYAHFTSPIRRYPDLIVHRQLKDLLLKRGEGTKDVKALVEASAHCSVTERNSEEAERALLEIKKYRYLEGLVKKRPPVIHEAAVAAVMRFGLFVELLDLQIQGFVHVSALPGGEGRFDKRQSVLRVGKQTFGLGMKLGVIVTGVDFERRRVDFAVADISA